MRVSPTAMKESLPRMTPAIMAFAGKSRSLSGFLVIPLPGATVYSIISALLPERYFTKRAFPDKVNLKILPAVISFLLITVSTPISSASRIYSIFSTSATVRGTPNFLATTHDRTLLSSLSVSAMKASKSLIPSS